MNTWWERMGYPPFAADSEGFPRPGQVTKYFRERLQKSSGWSWSQRDLGLVLNLSEITVRKMENTDMGLDSISRRRTLVKLLGIPPLLMGLAEPPSEASASSPADSSPTGGPRVLGSPLPATRAGAIDLASARAELEQFWDQNHFDTAFHSMARMEATLNQLYRQLPFMREPQYSEACALAIGFHLIYGNLLRDLCLFEDSAEELTCALQQARALGDSSLEAEALFRRGATYLDAHDPARSLQDCLQAEALLSRCEPALVPAILIQSALAHASLASTEQERCAALRRFDKAASALPNAQAAADRFHLHMNSDRFHLDRAAALLRLARPRDALAELDMRRPDPAFKRRNLYGEILEASAYASIGLQTMAASILAEVVPQAFAIRSAVNVERIQQLSAQLKTSPAAKEPEIAHLDYVLHELLSVAH